MKIVLYLMQGLESSDFETMELRQDLFVSWAALRTFGLQFDLLQRFLVQRGLAGS